MIEFTDFVCRRDGRALFKPISGRVDAGEAIELIGPNGAGKSTFLRALAGLHTQVDGEKHIARLLYQGHRLGLDPLATPLQNIRWFGNLLDNAVTDGQIREALQRVSMVRFATALVGRLSAGQQRRVGMARWLLDSAPVWLLDEPLTALDVEGQKLVDELIQEKLAAGGAVIYATHTDIPIPGKGKLEIEPVSEA